MRPRRSPGSWRASARRRKSPNSSATPSRGEDDAEDAQWLVVLEDPHAAYDRTLLDALAAAHEGWLATRLTRSAQPHLLPVPRPAATRPLAAVGIGGRRSAVGWHRPWADHRPPNGWSSATGQPITSRRVREAEATNGGASVPEVVRAARPPRSPSG